MKVKLLLSVILLICTHASVVYAQENEKTIKSKLNEATVFLHGAELTHTASTTLSSGYNEIKIDKLSPNIDRNSLKIKASNGVVISAFEFSVDEVPLKKLNESRIQILRDSVELITEQLDKVKVESKIDNELIQLMKKGTDRNVSDTLSIADLMKVMEYYQMKSSEIETRQITNRKKQKKLEVLISGVNQRLTKESINQYEKSGTLRINCSAPLSTASTFTISYYTPSANWIPYYDINIASTDKPIKIVSKAKVRQTTTVDWTKVKLTLSTATPSNGKVAPLFSAWFLQYISYEANTKNRLATQNSYSYELAKVEKKLDQTVMSGLPVADPAMPNSLLYIVDGAEVDENYYQSLDPTMIKDVRVDDDRVIVTLKDSMDDYVKTQENDLNLTFNIDLPYTIPGDGKEQSIELQTQETSAEYKYYCAPKLDSETYLLAEISGWEKLNLLSGKANITFDGTYVGETFINASSTQEKLSLTLGSDKRVTVKREPLKDYSSSKVLGNDMKQVFTYKLTVKNNQNKTVKMVLKDQYPKSTSKEIDTELLLKETTTPTFNKEETGVITWEENLKAGETKTYQISYSVKYPKGRNINL